MLDDDSQTILLNAGGSRLGVDKDLANLLDYIKTGVVTDDYTRSLEEDVQEIRQDMDWRDQFMTLEMKLDEKLEEGMKVGMKRGAELTIISLVCRKIKKGKYPEEIAEELDEDLSDICRIYEAALDFAPEYNEELIYQELNS